MEFVSKTHFWTQPSFFGDFNHWHFVFPSLSLMFNEIVHLGVNLSSLSEVSWKEVFRQPVVECIDPQVLQVILFFTDPTSIRSLLCIIFCIVVKGQPHRLPFDFLTCNEKDLQEVRNYHSNDFCSTLYGWNSVSKFLMRSIDSTHCDHCSISITIGSCRLCTC